MHSLKTYQNVNKEDEKLSFSISKMEDIHERRKGVVDEPHRHNFYTVLIVQKAKGEHKIDFNSYPLQDQQIYFVSPGQVHQVIEHERSIGFAMTFSTDFLIKNAISQEFISDLNLFENYGQSPPLEPNEQIFKKVVQYASEIDELFKSQQNNKLLSIGSFLKLILIQCSNICTLQSAEAEAQTHIIRHFKAAVDQHYHQEHSTTFYSNLLNISPDHLSRSVKDKLGTTAKDYIQARVLTEAKRLLLFTDLTTKEVGYEIGFSEPANFSAFFKKYTQTSPSNFKKTV